MKILGIHASYASTSHDPSASLIIDGRVVASIEEERLNRIKTSIGQFPERSIKACLEIGNISIHEIDYVVSDGITFPGMKCKIKRSIENMFGCCPSIELVEHSYSHCAGAFFSSGMEEALVVSVDGVGDKVSTLVCVMRKKSDGIHIDELYRSGPNESLGNFYTSFTNYLGFKSIEGEYKLMGMAAYGNPIFDLSKLIGFDRNSGVYAWPKEYENVENYTSITETSCNVDSIYKLTRVKRPEYGNGVFQQSHFDLAASVQERFSNTYLNLIKHFMYASGQKNLCISGGCGLNCLANKDLLNEDYSEIYVMPAASDRGLSMGSAMLLSASLGEKVLPAESMYLGKKYSNEEVIETLNRCGIDYANISDVFRDCANEIERGSVIGWMRGRSEFGPRALGNRSILANPRLSGMKDILNSKIKFRESYRPFAPAILESELNLSFKPKANFDSMVFTVDATEKLKKIIPEAVHFDGTSRIQSVSKKNNSDIDVLLSNVKDLTDVGAVINTSFNLANEPIVESPSDAIRTFFSSGIDVLYIQDLKITKRKSNV